MISYNNIIADIYKKGYFIDVFAVLFVFLIGKYIGQGNLMFALILIVPFSLLILFIKPFWGLILSIPLVIYFSYMDLFLVSPWNYLILLLAFINIITIFYKNSVCSNKYTVKILSICTLFIFWSTLVNIANHAPIVDVVVNLARLISFFLLAFCTMYFVEDEKRAKIFIFYTILILGISVFVGVMQFIGIDYFWYLREMRGLDPKADSDIISRTRIPGLADGSIALSYQIVGLVPLMLSFLVGGKNKMHKTKTFNAVIFFLYLMALLFTLSRGAVLGGIFGIIIVLYLYGKMKVSKLILPFSFMLIVIFVINVVFGGFLSQRFFNKSIDISALERVPVYIITAKIIIDHPFGIGRMDNNNYYLGYQDEYNEYLESYINKFSPERLDEFNDSNKEIIAPHNDFLNILIYYGFIGLFLVIAFYYYIFRGLFYLYRNTDHGFGRHMAIGMIGLFAGYIVNMMFHNDGPFLEDPFNWYFIGLTMLLFNFYGKKNKKNSRELEAS
jgi:hypothetical protein